VRGLRKPMEGGVCLDEGTPTVIPAALTGTPRDCRVLVARRDTDLIEFSASDDPGAPCRPRWADLALGRGPCSYQCRFCFLLLNHAGRVDPSCPVVYDHGEAAEREVRAWLSADTWRLPWSRGREVPRQTLDTLGLGSNQLDSLLYEGYTGVARRVIPLFADPATNPKGNDLLLQTKSANVHFLEGLPTENVTVVFSLNPESVADLWEGKYEDGVRITPPIRTRLEASRRAQQMGFEVRWRFDPILSPEGWQGMYRDFIREAAEVGGRPTRVTLGTYRERSPDLQEWRRFWGLPAPEWEPGELVQDGTHRHLPTEQRMLLYRTVIQQIAEVWPQMPRVDLCKEPSDIRQAVGLTGPSCCTCLHR